jgi:4'-phosphopantetheinyl transferase
VSHIEARYQNDVSADTAYAIRTPLLPRIPSRGAWANLALPARLDFSDHNESHVWATRAVWHTGPSCARYLGILSQAERNRAETFVFQRDREEYVIAHAMLRTLLARYLRCAPGDVALVNGNHGKPASRNNAALTFNLTHGQGAILVAVAPGYDIGIDIEQVRPLSGLRCLARRYFAPKEIERLSSARKTELDRAFLEIWTRKEAYLKALGVGLSQALNSFEVTSSSDTPFALYRGEPGPWSLFHLEPFRSFVGALAVRGPALRLAGGIVRAITSPSRS